MAMPIRPSRSRPRRAYRGVDSYVAAHLSGYALPQPTIATSATPLSPVGAYALTVTPPAASGFVAERYSYAFGGSTLTIAPAPLTIVSDNFSKVYGQSDPLLTYGVSGLKNGESAQTVVGGAQTRAAGENVGGYAVSQGTLAPNANYTIVSYTGGNLAITPAPLVVRADSDSRAYGDANPAWIAPGQAAHYTISGFVRGDEGGATPTALGSVDFATAATAASPVGPYAITGSNGVLVGPAAGNYVLQYASGQLLVTAAQLLVGAHDSVRTYGEANPAFDYGTTGWKNGDDAANTVTASLATIAGLTSGVGDYAIDVTSAVLSGPASGNYQLVTSPGTLHINPAPLTVSADDLSRVYGDPNPVLTATAAGWKNGDEALYSVAAALSTAATPATNVGQVPIAISGATLAGPNPANYVVGLLPGVLSITPAPLLVSANDAERIYGENNPAFHYRTTGWKNGDAAANSVSATLGTAAVVTSPVGSYAIDVTGATLAGPASGNYQLVPEAATLRIDPAQLTVSADDQSRLYGEDNPALTATTTGWKNGDDLTTAMVSALSTPATIASDVGLYPITVDSAALSGPASANYVIVRLPGTLFVSAAPLLVVSADDFSRLYGDANPTFTFQVAGWRGTDEASNTVDATLSSSATPASNVGDYAIVVSGATVVGPQALNYTLQTQNGVLTVLPVPLVVSADNLSRIYGDPNPTLTALGEGWRNGDEALYTVMASLSTPATAATHVGEAPIDIAGASLSGPNPANYTLHLLPGVLSITPAPLTVSANDAARTYGDPNPVFTATTVGWKNGDDATNHVAADLATVAGIATGVGSYAIDVASATFSGPAVGDYLLTAAAATLRIDPAVLTVSADDRSRIYGDPNPVLTATTGGWKNGDELTTSVIATLSTPATTASPVGSYAIDVAGAALSGAAAANYAIVTQAGSLAVTPAPLTVRAGTYSKIYGDGDPLLGFQVEGLRNGDAAPQVLSGAGRARRRRGCRCLCRSRRVAGLALEQLHARLHRRRPVDRARAAGCDGRRRHESLRRRRSRAALQRRRIALRRHGFFRADGQSGPRRRRERRNLRHPRRQPCPGIGELHAVFRARRLRDHPRAAARQGRQSCQAIWRCRSGLHLCGAGLAQRRQRRGGPERGLGSRPRRECGRLRHPAGKPGDWRRPTTPSPSPMAPCASRRRLWSWSRTRRKRPSAKPILCCPMPWRASSTATTRPMSSAATSPARRARRSGPIRSVWGRSRSTAPTTRSASAKRPS
ncbi:MAG: MBG domain-containing protein [Rhizomicrobium sp.]